MKGKKCSIEMRNKISESCKGRRAWNKGKCGCISESTRLKLSLAHKGRATQAKGKHWYNDGVKTIYAYTCPDGFVKGRLKRL